MIAKSVALDDPMNLHEITITSPDSSVVARIRVTGSGALACEVVRPGGVFHVSFPESRNVTVVAPDNSGPYVCLPAIEIDATPT